MNDKFNTLPSPDEYAQFVTWTGLEDALQGIRQDFESKFPSPDDFTQGIKQDKENLKPLPMERVVMEMSSQTDPVHVVSHSLYQ